MAELPIEDQVDQLFKDKPKVLQKIKENQRYINHISKNKISEPHDKTVVFGVKSVNYNAILKDNINDHSIFTIDKLCRLHRNMTFEQLKKYQAKKRHIPFNMLWIFIIIIGIVVAVLVVLFLLPKLGVM